MNAFERQMLDVAQNSAWIAQYARQDATVLAIDYYSYVSSLLATAIGASATNTIQTQADSDFVLVYLAGQMVVGGAVTTGAVETIQFTDQNTGKTFFSVPAALQLVMGNAGTPLYLPQPRVIKANSTISWTVTAVSSAASAAIDTYIALMGVRIYYQ